MKGSPSGPECQSQRRSLQRRRKPPDSSQRRRLGAAGPGAQGSPPEDARPLYSLRPALEGGDREQCHHSRKHVVEVEITVLPDPLTDHRAIDVAILVEDEKPPGEEKGGGSSWLDMKSVTAAPRRAVGTVLLGASRAAHSVLLLFLPCI